MFKSICDNLCIKIREKMNPYLGSGRCKHLNIRNFTIISNNCWGGHVYRYFNLPYNSPTIGMYFFADDYIKLLSNLRHYMSEPIRFISYKESRYKGKLEQYGGKNITCPIGVIDDIECIFLHYKDEDEACSKWTRRTKRINWDNMYVKFSEQNGCTIEHLKQFEQLPYKNKIVFTSKDYKISSQIIFTEFLNSDRVKDDTTHFRKYINLIKWINCESCSRNQPKK